MWDKRSDMLVHSEDPYNAEPPRTALSGAALTPVEAFYSRNHGPVPELDPAAWTLRVDGMVERPATFSVAELQRGFAAHTEVVTLQCAGNRRAGLLDVRDIPGEAPWGPAATATAPFTGVRLGDVLRHVGVDPRATDVAFEGADVATSPDTGAEFGGSVPLAKALAGEVLLAWSMNDAPLPALHGAPVRVVVPGYIGARSVKWLRRVTVQDHPSTNFFQASSYRLLPPDADPAAARPGDGVPLGAIAVNADVLNHEDGDHVPAGPTLVEGYAVAGGERTIVRVDVSADGGRTWDQAELGDQMSTWTWRHWRATLDLAPGEHEVLARAWDSAAALQPASPADVWNPKGYVNNSWARVRLHATRPQERP